MLVPAILYKDEIYKKFSEHNYSDEMFFYSGYLGNQMPNIENNSDGAYYHYAILDDYGELIGYFTYYIDWYSSNVCNFGLYAFDKNNVVIGYDVYKEIKKIINDYHIHRIEWRMVGGNPVEKHYDRFCKRYKGKKFVLTDSIKDRYGKYHNDIVYEIIFNDKKGGAEE